MQRAHRYELELRWSGNTGSGTSGYGAYSRDSVLTAGVKGAIAGSSDPAFRGDPGRWNPEELLVGALSQCHMLWYLHLAANAGIVVVAYSDAPVGTMEENPDGSGQFAEVVLRPSVTVTDPATCSLAEAMHDEAGKMCFVARSVSFPVRREPVTVVLDDPAE